jgi:hypothetical protein
LNASHRAKPWKHKLVFDTSNFRMQVKQILGQENLVQNLKTSKFLLRCHMSASLDNWYPPFRDVLAYLHGSCTFRCFSMKALHRFETSVTPCHITEQRRPTTPLRLPKNSQSFNVSEASGYVIRPMDSPMCERMDRVSIPGKVLR